MSVTILVLLAVIVRYTYTGQMMLPYISKHPSSQICLPGSEIHLNCETNMIPGNAEVTWLFDDLPLNSNHYVQFVGNELILRDKLHLQGNYSCIVNTPQGKLKSHKAKLRLPFIKGFRRRPADHSSLLELNVLAGSLVILSCTRPASVPTAAVFWYSPSGILKQNSEKFRIISNLYIFDVQPSDMGFYRCAAQNPLTNEMVNDTRKIFLRVYTDAKQVRLSSRTVIEPPAAFKAVLGSNLTLECGVSNNDGKIPFISWEKFGSSLPEERARYDTKSGVLEICNLTREDRGTYICKVVIDQKSPISMYKSLIEVEEPASIDGSSLNEGIETMLGSSLHLTCPVKGKPHPTVRWYFNGNLINSTTGNIVAGQTLSISAVTHHEEGIYQCFAENIHGEASKTFLISVRPEEGEAKLEGQVSLRDNGTSVSIVRGPMNTTVEHGGTVVLTCVVEGNGYLSISWLHNNQPLRSSQAGPRCLDQEAATSSLRISDVRKSDSGIYTCIVKSGNVKSVAASGYVEVLPKDFQNYNRPNLKIRGHRVIQTNGKINDDDQMKFHQRKSLMSPSGIEDVKIVLTDITDLGPEEGIALKWEVLQGSRNVHHFKVLYRRGGTDTKNGEYFSLDESLSPDVRSFIVDSLAPETPYTFKIEAVTKSGQRYDSNDKEYTRVKKRPSSPAKTLPSPVITEIWEVPSSNKRSLTVGLKWMIKTSLPIDGFKIHYRSLDDGQGSYSEIKVPVGQSKVAPGSSRVFTHSIRDLSHAKEYEFRVCAFNKQRSSELSNTVSIFKSGNGAESIVRIQDSSAHYMEDSFVDHEMLSGPKRLGVMNGVNHQSMLLYTSLGIALVSLLLFLFTATLIFMLRHYRRRRQFPNGRGGSLSSFDSKRCVAARKLNLNEPVCYCENMSTSPTTTGLSLPKLFSFTRRDDAQRRVEEGAPLRSVEGSECGIYTNRCSSCRLMMNSLNEGITDQNNLLIHQGSTHYQTGENFYHTLAAETPAETLVCQCCGQRATVEETYAFQRARQCCFAPHCCICTRRQIATLRSQAQTTFSGSSGIGSGGSGNKMPNGECSEVTKPLLDCRSGDEQAGGQG